MSLREDFELNFTSGTTTRMLIDPSEIQTLFPNASYLDVFDLVRQYSLEVKDILGLDDDDDDEIPFEAQDYIRAAVACALTRLYDLSGLGGGGGDVSFRLGDLQVDTTRGNNRTVTRATATTWCELAAVLKDELLRIEGGAGLREVVRGSRNWNPMPSRVIRHKSNAPMTIYSDD